MSTRLPVDSGRIEFIATGKLRPVREYGELADGSRRAIPDSQATRDGVPLWTVDVMLTDDESDRDEAVGIKVASASEPQPPKYKPITFEGLTVRPYLDRKTNRVALSFTADRIADGAAGRKSSGGEQ